MMCIRMVSTLLLLASAAVAAAEPLSDWLVSELTIAMDNSDAEISPERRALLVEQATEHTQGFRVRDLAPCHLEEISRHLVPGVVSEARGGLPNDALRYTFVVRLLMVLHAPAYEALQPDRVVVQIEALAAAFRENLNGILGDLLDSALLDDTERELSSRMREVSSRCTMSMYKAPLPEDDFKFLLETVRHAPIEDEFLMQSVIKDLRREAGYFTDAEREHRANLEAMADRAGVTPEERERMLRLGRPAMNEEATVGRLVAAAELLLMEKAFPLWAQHTEETFHAPGDREIRQARLMAALEDAGAGAEAGMNLFADRALSADSLER